MVNNWLKLSAACHRQLFCSCVRKHSLVCLDRADIICKELQTPSRGHMITTRRRPQGCLSMTSTHDKEWEHSPPIYKLSYFLYTYINPSKYLQVVTLQYFNGPIDTVVKSISLYCREDLHHVESRKRRSCPVSNGVLQ